MLHQLLRKYTLSELEKLKQEGSWHPVTLMYMPMQYMSHAMRGARKILTWCIHLSKVSMYYKLIFFIV